MSVNFKSANVIKLNKRLRGRKPFKIEVNWRDITTKYTWF